jgi:predicted nuclease of predicted toxin-antitoxin system
LEIRYHLDEHLDPAIAVGLRRRGVDVTTTVDARLSGASDLAQLAFATRNHRVLVTRDTDFLALNADGVSHGGIASGIRGIAVWAN